MKSLVKIQLVALAVLTLAASITFGATVTVTPNTLPKDAYIIGQDGDHYFAQVIEITLAADGTGIPYVGGETITIDLPTGVEVADIGANGRNTQVSAAWYDALTEASPLNLIAGNITSPAVDQIVITLTGQDADAGDKLVIMFPVTTVVSPSAGDYTITISGNMEASSPNTVAVTFVDDLALATFNTPVIASGGDTTDYKGKLHPSSAANLFNPILTEHFNDYEPPTGGAVGVVNSATDWDGITLNSSNNGANVDATAYITMLAKTSLADQEIFTLTNAAGTGIIFEFELAGGGSGGEDVLVDISPDATSDEVATTAVTDIDGHADFTSSISTAAVGATAVIQAIAQGAALIADDEIFTLLDEAGTSVIFEFDTDADFPQTFGDVVVTIADLDAAAVVATAIAGAVNGHGSFSAVVDPADDTKVNVTQADGGIEGDQNNTEGVTGAGFTVANFAGGLDAVILVTQDPTGAGATGNQPNSTDVADGNFAITNFTGGVDLDLVAGGEVLYYLWASTLKDQTRMNTQLGRRIKTDANTLWAPEVEASGANGQIYTADLTEDTWYFYVTTNITSEWVYASSDSLLVNHYPMFATGNNDLDGGWVDWDANDSYDPSGGSGADNKTLLVLESGGTLDREGNINNGTPDNTDSVTIYWEVEDVDDDATITVWLSTSSSLTLSDIVLDGSNLVTGLGATATQVPGSGTFQENSSTKSVVYNSVRSVADFDAADTYYIYIVANDTKHQQLRLIQDEASTALQVKVMHYPYFAFTDIHGGAIALDTGDDQMLELSWGGGTPGYDGDKDLDATSGSPAGIKLYASELDLDNAHAVGAAVTENDPSFLAADVGITTYLIADFDDISDTRLGNRYMWDVRNEGLTDAATYYIYAVITHGSDQLVVQYKSSPLLDDTNENDRGVTISHSDYFLANNPYEGEVLELNQSDFYTFTWNASNGGSSAGLVKIMLVPAGTNAIIDSFSVVTSANAYGGPVLYTPAAVDPNDLTLGGTYTGTDRISIKIILDAAASPDEMDLYVDGALVQKDIVLTVAALTLVDGITATFGSQDADHTDGDQYEWAVFPSADKADAFWLRTGGDGSTPGTAITGYAAILGETTLEVAVLTDGWAGGTDAPYVALAVPEYEVYYWYSSDGTFDTETAVKADGNLYFNGDDAGASYNFRITPSAVTAEVGDTLTFLLEGTYTNGTNVAMIYAYLDIPSANLLVLGAADSVFTPGTDVSGTVISNTLTLVGDTYQLNYEEFVSGAGYDFNSDWDNDLATFKVVVTANYTGAGFDHNLITFSSSDPRRTGLFEPVTLDRFSDVAVPTTAGDIRLYRRGSIEVAVELEGRTEEDEWVDVILSPSGGNSPLNDARFLTGNSDSDYADGIQKQLDAGGVLTLSDVPEGVYDITVSKVGYPNERAFDITVQPTSKASVNFRNDDKLWLGDIVGYVDPDGNKLADNEIDDSDENEVLNVIIGAITNANADLNADGATDIVDLAFVVKNNAAWGSGKYASEGLIYKEISVIEGDNNKAEVSLELAGNAGGEYTYVINAINLASLRAYDLSLEINSEDWELVSREDGLLAFGNATSLTLENGHEFSLISASALWDGIVEPEMELASITLRARHMNPEEPTLSRATIVDGSFAKSQALISGPAAMPTEFSLSQNFPNPFNPTTTISFALPEAGHVKLMVFNLLGQEVRSLVADSKDAGNYKVIWNSRNHAGQQVSSGIYFYRLVVDNKVVDTKKMLLLK